MTERWSGLSYRRQRAFHCVKGSYQMRSSGNWVQQQLPANYDSRLVQEEWYNGYILDQDVYELIASLRKKYSIIAFSGNIKEPHRFFRGEVSLPSSIRYLVYSFDFHLTKPEPAFVETRLQGLESRPEEIVYIDDNETYANPARELGVNVIIYRRANRATTSRADDTMEWTLASDGLPEELI